jgi:type IV fimbrial biogenesis protein FimT
MVSLSIESVAGAVHASRRNRQVHKAYPEGLRRTGPSNSWDNRQEVEMKRNNAGFTIYELMIVVAIIAILSAIAVPNMIGWRERGKLRGAFENLRGDLQWAKIRAIRDHDLVAVVFEPGRYEIIDDAGFGVTVRARQLSAGVVIDLDASTIPQDPNNLNQLMTLFNSRGRCAQNTDNEDTNGLLVLEDSTGEQRQISINPLGQIRQE